MLNHLRRWWLTYLAALFALVMIAIITISSSEISILSILLVVLVLALSFAYGLIPFLVAQKHAKPKDKNNYNQPEPPL